MNKNRTEDPNIASERIDVLEKGEIFVAEWGVGAGLTGQSYAIPTMQGDIDTIKPYVDEFIEFAKQHQDMKFLVTRIGCGIAGFKEEDIAPLFRSAVLEKNIYLPQGFFNIIMTPYIEH